MAFAFRILQFECIGLDRRTVLGLDQSFEVTDADQRAVICIADEEGDGTRLHFAGAEIGIIGRDLFGLHGLTQSIAQFVGAVGRKIEPARGIGEALHLPAFFFRQSEPDHMGGEVDACAFKLAPESARVGVAGLDSVGHQHDRGGIFCVSQFLGCHAHRV